MTQRKRKNVSPSLYDQEDCFIVNRQESRADMPSGVITNSPVDRILPKTSFASLDTNPERISSLQTLCSDADIPRVDSIVPQLMRSKTSMYILNVMFEFFSWAVSISCAILIGWFARC